MLPFWLTSVFLTFSQHTDSKFSTQHIQTHIMVTILREKNLIHQG